MTHAYGTLTAPSARKSWYIQMQRMVVAVMVAMTTVVLPQTAPTASGQSETIIADFGDAPLPYPTLLSESGPRHNIGNTQFTLYMGNSQDGDVDQDADGQRDGVGGANGDDLNDGNDDDDGVTFPDVLMACKPSSAKVEVHNTTGGAAKLSAWIDFNRDGSWGGAGEKIASDKDITTPLTTLTFPVPCNAVPGVTFARFRLDSEGGLTYWDNTGSAPDGEVEDHAVEISVPGADIAIVKTDEPDPVSLGSTLRYRLAVTNHGPLTATGVTVTDTLPVELAYLGHFAPTGSCNVANGVIVCSLADLPSGQSTEIVIDANVLAGAGGNVINHALVRANEVDPVPSNNEDQECTTVESSSSHIDLAVVKSDNPDPIPTGHVLTYTFVVSNEGETLATGVSVTDTLPTETEYIAHTVTPTPWENADCIYQQSPHTLNCAFGNLGVGESITVTVASTVTMLIEPDENGQIEDRYITNLVTVKGNEPDPNFDNNTDIETTTILYGCCVDIVLTLDRSISLFGAFLVLQEAAIEFVNATDLTKHRIGVVAFAGTVEVIHPLTDTAASLISAISGMTQEGGGTDMAGGISLAHAMLVDEESREYCDKLMVVFTDGRQYLVPGDPVAAAAAAKADKIYIVSVGYGWLVDEDELKAIATTPEDYHHAVTPEDIEEIFLTIAATVCKPPQGKPSDIGLTKAAFPDIVAPCATLTYTLTITNYGPDRAYDVNVTDTLPVHVTFVGAETGQIGRECRDTGNIVTCDLNPMDKLEVAQITITTTVNAALPPGLQSMTNTARVDAANPDANPNNNEDYVITVVTQQTGDLVVTKAADRPQAFAGETVTYTMEVVNSGLGVAEDSYLVDALPIGVEYVNHDVSQVPPGVAGCIHVPDPDPNKPGVLDCTLGDLVSGGVVTATLATRVKCETAAGAITNTVNVGQAHPECNPGDNQAATQTEILRKADLAIEKGAALEIESGQLLTYAITVTNHGPSSATNVRVVDVLPKPTLIRGVLQNILVTGGGVCDFTSNPNQGLCTWPSLGCGITETITFEFIADPDLLVPCSLDITNGVSVSADETDPVISNNEDTAETKIVRSSGDHLCPDLGDTPDSLNHAGVPMSAYTGVLAAFPTVFERSMGAPPGPKHLRSKDDAYLGAAVTEENDADVPPDEDGSTNIEPLTNTPDQDLADDGVDTTTLSVSTCGPSMVTYNIMLPLLASKIVPQPDRFINVWLDFNRDGDWDDTLVCTDPLGRQVVVREWAVQNQNVGNLEVGINPHSSPFLGTNPPAPMSPMWMRVSLGSAQAPLPGDGRGPSEGYLFGESEDYLLTDGVQPPFPPMVQLGVDEVALRTMGYESDSWRWMVPR